MATRAERQVELLAQQIAFQHSLRAIESVHADVHEALLDWGRWGRDRYPGRPEIARPAIWEMPGEPPEWAEDVVPEAPEAPIDEKRVLELDAVINAMETFPTLLAKLLYVNYVWRPIEWERPLIVHVAEESYLLQLHHALTRLA